MEDNKKIVEADNLSSFWLAEYNEAKEKGEFKKAESALRKAQYWLDRWNKLIGDG